MEKPERAIPVVCDAGPLIHLDELGCLDLLADFQEALVPEEVWQEVLQHRPSALHRRSVPLKRIDHPSEPNERLARVIRLFDLQRGEAEALSMLEELPGGMLLTDDLAARHAAQHLGLPVSGTLGLLLRALRRNLRTRQQVIKLLRVVHRKSSLFVDQGLLNSIIEQVQEV